MQVMEGEGKIMSSHPHLLRAVISVPGEGSGREVERPEGFHVSPGPEKGISQGILTRAFWEP